MFLTSWLSRLSSRPAVHSWNGRRSQRKNHGRAGRQSVECLENRTLLTVTSILNGTELRVFSDAGESLIVSRDPSTGNTSVTANGAAVSGLPAISASAMTGLQVITGSDDDTIDLSQLTAMDFPVLTVIAVDSGDGNDLLTGSTDFIETFVAGDGNDTLSGLGGNDLLFGGDGNDSLIGASGDELLDGGDGNDTISGGDGADSIIAGDGDDVLAGDAGSDTIDAGQGQDTIDGGADGDSVLGGAGHDSILGGDGDDTLLGGSEHDTILGGAGNDSVNGQSGRDVIVGEDGNDTLIGGSGNDSVSGDMGNDTINGNRGNDTLVGNDGNDNVLGGSGRDLIEGRSGNDVLNGQGGNDSLIGGFDSDTIFGGNGNDLVESGAQGLLVSDATNVTEGNSGTTTATFIVTLTAPSSLTVTVDVSTSDGTATAGIDYTPVNTTLSFAPSVITRTVNVQVLGDTAFENGETFFLNLSNPSNASIQDGLGQGGIIDDDLGTGTQIGLNFLGSELFNGSNSIPPDTMGAVGSNHIVEFINGRYEVYDKTDGSVLESLSQTQFWLAAGASGGGQFDPRIIYDPTVNRWFASAIDGGSGPARTANILFVAVSITDDPTDGWQSVEFIGDTIDGSRFNDYDTFGIDADGVYLATNNFGNGFDVSIFSIPKADLLGATPSAANLTRFEALNAGVFGNSIQAAVDFDASDGRAAVLATAGSGTLVRTDVLGATGPGATLGPTVNIAVPPYSGAPNARQPGGTLPLENVSPRFTGNVMEVDGSLWAAHAVLDPNNNSSAVRWYEIDEVTNALLQTGLITDPNLDFLDPSIAVNSSGTVVVGYTGTGPNQNPSAFASIGTTVGGVTTFDPPLLTQAGAGTYNVTFGSGRNRWGDYSATVVDPDDPFTFWTFQEIASAQNVWGIQITEITTGSGPVPAPPPSPAPTGDVGDRIESGSGADTVRAGGGDDTINGGASNDLILGNGGNDSILGGSGMDTLVGGEGDDTLDGQGGSDQLDSGPGANELGWSGSGAGDDVVVENDGFERLVVQGGSSANAFTFSVVNGLLTIAEGSASFTLNDDISDVQVLGGNGDDTFAFTSSLQGVQPLYLVIDGEAGDDTLDANGFSLGSVRLRLNGGDGNDTISGSSGSDVIDGGAGDDSLSGDDGDDELTGGAGGDTISGDQGADTLFGNDGNDNLSGGNDNDSLVGGFGNDVLNGNDDDDTLEGGFGNDTMSGSQGDDSLEGNQGRDTLQGGSGSDTLKGGTEADLIKGQGGNDSIQGGDGDDTIFGNAGTDVIDAGDGDDSVQGNNGNDIIDAGDGDDTLLGGGGKDSLLGGNGNDAMNGASGADLLFGGDGNDSLRGKGSTDRFNSGEGQDTLPDLEAGETDDGSLTLPLSLVQALAALNGV